MFWQTYNDAVLLVGLQADAGDITDVGTSQRPEEAGLTVLMAGEELFFCHHQTAGDTR